MSQYEFFIAIASVVTAFGLGELARFWGDMLQRANRGRVGFVRFGWSISVMIVAIQYWVGMWAYESEPFTHFRDVFMLVLPSLLFVLACHALTGETADDRPDEDVYFGQNKAVFYYAWTAFSLSSVLADFVLLPVGVIGLAEVLPFLALAAPNIVLAHVDRRWPHVVWMLAILTLTVLINAMLPLTILARGAQ